MSRRVVKSPDTAADAASFVGDVTGLLSQPRSRDEAGLIGEGVYRLIDGYRREVGPRDFSRFAAHLATIAATLATESTTAAAFIDGYVQAVKDGR